MLTFSESAFRHQAKADGITHLSTGVAVLHDGKILIVRRAANDYLGGQFELPGGGVDDGEKIAEAAMRELQEETGLTTSRILAVFAGFDYSTDRKPFVRQINFLVESNDDMVVLNPAEHDEYRWVDAETDLDPLMSGDMKICVEEAVRLAKDLKLYLCTLEIEPLIVGTVYNPLPSHLTLVSRFWSDMSAPDLASALQPIVAGSLPIKLRIGTEAEIGPHKTAVHLVENSAELKLLHSKIVDRLRDFGVTFTQPEFIDSGHRPHISTRDSTRFETGQILSSRHMYLIEVEKVGAQSLRHIRAKLPRTDKSE